VHSSKDIITDWWKIERKAETRIFWLRSGGEDWVGGKRIEKLILSGGV